MPPDAETARHLSEGAAAVTGVAAVAVIAMQIARAIKRGAQNTARWAQDWAAVPGRVARIATDTDARFVRVEDEIAHLGASVSQSLDADGRAHWRADANGNCTSVSPGYVRLTGHGESECLGRGWISGIHPDDYDLAVEQFLDAVGDRRTFDAQYRMMTPAGPVYVHCIARPVMAGARCVGYVGMIEQITGPTA